MKKTNFRVALRHTAIATYGDHCLQSSLSADERITRNNYLYQLAAVQEVDNRRALRACIVVVAELSLVRCPGVSSQKTKWKASVRVFIPKTLIGRLVVIAEKTSHCFSITLPSTEIRFKMLRSRKTVRFSEQIMSADKYPSIFSRQMDAIVYLNFSWVDSPWHMHFYRINDIFVIELTISFGTLVF